MRPEKIKIIQIAKEWDICKTVDKNIQHRMINE